MQKGKRQINVLTSIKRQGNTDIVFLQIAVKGKKLVKKNLKKKKQDLCRVYPAAVLLFYIKWGMHMPMQRKMSLMRRICYAEILQAVFRLLLCD